MANATQTQWIWGIGRRKTAVARVRIREGSGVIEINGRTVEDFFHEPQHRNAVFAALDATNMRGKLDIYVKTTGGGIAGQAGACMLGIARALKDYDASFYGALRDASLLTRDSRMKERKKYGQPGARKKFQFSKR